MIHRRAFIGGLIATLAAPAIVRVDSLMSLRSTKPQFIGFDLGSQDYTVKSIYLPSEDRMMPLDEYSRRILDPVFRNLIAALNDEIVNGDYAPISGFLA